MKKYFDWGKTDLWGFMRFLDTMKIHGIIENDCEDFIRIWWTNIELARHRAIWWLSICPSDTNARTRRPRPSSRQKVTMVGHFPSCFTKYSQKSNQVYIYEALSNHKLWNFGGKNLNTELASSHAPDPHKQMLWKTTFKKDESYCEKSGQSWNSCNSIQILRNRVWRINSWLVSFLDYIFILKVVV